MEEKRNNETFLEYAIRILDEDNVSENGLINTYYMLFQDVDHISYDNAQRQLRGIRKFIDKIKKENNNIVLEKQNSSNIDISINSDGTQTRNALLVLSEEEIKTPELLLKAHGYSSKDFELVSSKNSMWHQNSNTNGLTTLYCSKITVKPRTEISLEEVEEIFKRMDREKSKENKVIKLSKFSKDKKNEFCNESLVLNFFDVHFSKLAHKSETDENYDYKIAKRRMIDSIDEYMRRFKDRHFDNIYFAIGQDYFNSEPTGSTVGNTRQDNDSRYSVMFEEGVSTLIDIIDKLKTMGDTVYVPLIQGNHSTYTEFYAAQYIKAWYRQDENVVVDASPIPRKYFRYGVNLFGFTHNSEEKNRIYNLMQVEAPEDWAYTLERTWFTGHLHCEDVKENGGVYIRQAPTLCGTDAWHKRTGYVNPIKRTQCFVYDKEEGLKETQYVIVK